MGYSVDLFLDENIDEEFLCTICHDVLQDVTMISSCEHVFCKICILSWKATRPTCPIDRQAMTKFQTPQRSFMNLLGRLQMRCPFNELGCTHTISLGDAKIHEEKCMANPENQIIPCQRGCGASFKKRDRINHFCPGSEPAPLSANVLQQPNDIWFGTLEWKERNGAAQSQIKEIQCRIVGGTTTPPIPFNGANWPAKMLMRLFPRKFIYTPSGRLNGAAFGQSDYIQFNFPEGANLASLKRRLSTDSLGCIQLHNPSRLCVLTHAIRDDQTDAYTGIIPRNQQTFMAHLSSLLRAQSRTQPTPSLEIRIPRLSVPTVSFVPLPRVSHFAVPGNSNAPQPTPAPAPVHNAGPLVSGSLRILIRRAELANPPDPNYPSPPSAHANGPFQLQPPAPSPAPDVASIYPQASSASNPSLRIRLGAGSDHTARHQRHGRSRLEMLERFYRFYTRDRSYRNHGNGQNAGPPAPDPSGNNGSLG